MSICTKEKGSGYYGENSGCFNELNKSVEVATKAIERFTETSNQIIAGFTGKHKKRVLKEQLFMSQIDNLTDWIKGEICKGMAGDKRFCVGCELEGTHCEGSRCENQADYIFEGMERSEKLEWAKITLGRDLWNNLSLRMKKEILNY